MDKRDRFIAEIREEAKALGLSFRLSKVRGKGGHAFLWVGDRTTALPSREIDPKTARKIRKTLGPHEALPNEATMRTYTYPALFEPGDEAGVTVTFRDIPEAITQGDDASDARLMAGEVLGLTLLHYLSANKPLPKATRAEPGETLVTADAEYAAKLAVIEAFHHAGLSKIQLAERLGKDEREIRRILDPAHATKMPALTAALAALGHRFVLGVEAA